MFKYIASGILAGLINGFLGAGGGVILVPLLISWIKLPAEKAFASSVCIIFPICCISAVLYLKNGSVNISDALPYLTGGLAGGIVCGKIYPHLPVIYLRRAFGLLLIMGGVSRLL